MDNYPTLIWKFIVEQVCPLPVRVMGRIVGASRRGAEGNKKNVSR